MFNVKTQTFDSIFANIIQNILIKYLIISNFIEMKTYSRSNEYGTYSIKSLRTNSKDKSQNRSSIGNQSPIRPQNMRNRVRDQYLIHINRNRRPSSISLRNQQNRSNSRSYNNYKGGRFNQKQITQLTLEIENLKRQIQKKDRTILTMKSNELKTKQFKSQLVQAFRVIHFYQGKIIALEANSKMLEQSQPFINEAARLGQYFQQSFLKLKRQNQDLSAQLQQRKYEFQQMEDKYRKSESRSMNLYRKIKYSELGKRRSETSDLSRNQVEESYYPNSNNTNLSTDGQKALLNKELLIELHQKTSVLQEKIKQLEQEHQKVHNELKQKMNRIKDLQISNEQLEQQLRIIKISSKKYEQISIRESKNKQRSSVDQDSKLSKPSTSRHCFKLKQQKSQYKVLVNNQIKGLKHKQSQLHKVVILPKSLINKVRNSSSSKELICQRSEDSSTKSQENDITEIQLLKEFNSQSQKKLSTFSKKIIPEINIDQNLIRKLRFKAMRSTISYKQLLELLASLGKNQFSINEESTIKSLVEPPFTLSIDENNQIQQKVLLYQGGSIQLALSEIIHPYCNISLMQDLSLVSQISNRFRNRQDQVESIMKQYSYKLDHQFITNLLIQWDLNAKQIDFVCLKAYQLSEELGYVDFQLISDYFLRN